jgi:hypothetical protein
MEDSGPTLTLRIATRLRGDRGGTILLEITVLSAVIRRLPRFTPGPFNMTPLPKPTLRRRKGFRVLELDITLEVAGPTLTDLTSPNDVLNVIKPSSFSSILEDVIGSKIVEGKDIRS